MSPVLVITGPSGVGKSQMLGSVSEQSAGALFVVDGMADGCTHFIPPAVPESCNAVAVDHFELGRWDLVEDAFAWCQEHQKHLWVVAQNRQSIETFIPEILTGAVELQMAEVQGQAQLTLIYGSERRVFAPSEILAAGIARNALTPK